MAKSLEQTITSILAGIDVYSLDRPAAKGVGTIKKQLIESRLQVRDYELSETREEQLKHQKIARKRLEEIRNSILTLSEYNIFNPVDVAQLSAQVEMIAERLE
jgi:hypothetical protein